MLAFFASIPATSQETPCSISRTRGTPVRGIQSVAAGTPRNSTVGRHKLSDSHLFESLTESSSASPINGECALVDYSDRAKAIMKKLHLILALLSVSLPISAQSIYVYPATVTAPRGTVQSVTAVVTGVNDKTVTWSTSGGTLVGTNPGTANEPNTIALHTTTPGTYTVTATTNTGAVTGTSVITFTASPTPASTHPRLMVT